MAPFTSVVETRAAHSRVVRASPHHRLLSVASLRPGASVRRADESAQPGTNRPVSLLDEARRRMRSNMQANISLLRLCPEGIEHPFAAAVLGRMEAHLQSMAALHRARC